MAVMTGCVTPGALQQIPVSQDELDRFLASGRDARNYGITIYSGAAGDRFEFANRVHRDRSAKMNFAGPKNLCVPVLRARTATFVDFNLLLDSSARQNWLLLASVKAMDYRTFKPPIGEYADHVESDIPGYAGVANKIVLDKCHVESPVFYVPPARGKLGPLARAGKQNEFVVEDKTTKAHRTLATQTHAVMGAALMNSFAYIRFDFPGRSVYFNTHGTFRPAAASAVRASLPLRSWRGRPAVQGILNGEPVLLVIDTAGDFALSLPEDTGATGPLVLGDLQIDEVQAETHADLGLPEAFPARLGLGILADYTVTLDTKQRRVWIEDPSGPATKASDVIYEIESPAPLQYRGIKR